MSGYFQDLDKVVEEIVATQASPEAAKWLETLYAGLTAKMNEIHDEGESATFADELAVAWILARTKANADPDETVRKLLHWGDTDEYGLLGEITEPMLKALGARGRAALQKARPDNVHLSKSIAESNGDSKAYLALCDQGKVDPGDALALAQIAMRRRRLDEAGTWVERGLKSAKEESSSRYQLMELKKDLLRKLGRPEETLALEWEEFRSHPAAADGKTYQVEYFQPRRHPVRRLPRQFQTRYPVSSGDGTRGCAGRRGGRRDGTNAGVQGERGR